jgi:hypothetical protein
MSQDSDSSRTDVERWRRPYVIHVVIPHLECWAEGCDGPLVADMVWNDQRHGAIHRVEICGFHLWVFRELVRERKVGAVFFPLGQAPPLEYIAAKMQEEMQRRQPPVYRPMWGNINYTFTQTGTTSGWINFG